MSGRNLLFKASIDANGVQNPCYGLGERKLDIVLMFSLSVKLPVVSVQSYPGKCSHFLPARVGIPRHLTARALLNDFMLTFSIFVSKAIQTVAIFPVEDKP